MNELIKYFQEKVIFLPKKLHENYQFQFEKPFQEYFFKTKNDGNINALYFEVENPKGVILYFHGNADNLHRWAKIASHFTDYNYNVLVMDYRTFGKSTGESTEENLYTDAQFCYDFLKNLFAENQIIVYGRSLGGVFANYISAYNKPKNLILECSFYNLEDMVKRWLNTSITSKFNPYMQYKLESNEFIKNVACPITHFHGTNDFIVPIISGKKLFKEISHQNKKFVEIPGGGHNDLIKYHLFNDEIKKILQ